MRHTHSEMAEILGMEEEILEVAIKRAKVKTRLVLNEPKGKLGFHLQKTRFLSTNF